MDTVKLNSAKKIHFYNNVDFCVGTGRIGLALTEEYVKELELVQEEIGFKHIRGHGLFCDDMAIYHEYEEDGVTKVEYNYTYLDRVFDMYLRLNIRPFIELGFMPYKLARGTQTIFYWRGNTTPPKDYEMWCDMVKALLSHLMDRYGAEDVVTWPIEVWNEPNLPGFWEKADMEEYFKLFKHTIAAIKSVDERFQVCGPAICGVREVEWMTKFLDFCRENGIKPDAISRHHYTIQNPTRIGHYDYSKFMDAEEGFNNLKGSRDIIDSYKEFEGLPIHITEFNSSYTPKGVVHDTNFNAAWQAQQLSRLGDVNESYSYWTFGDVFEEEGVPFTPFHGGFGLVANGCIPKPTFWTFAFYSKLKEKEDHAIYKDDSMVVVATKDGGYAGIIWNVTESEISRNLEIPGTKEGVAILKTVDEKTCNPLKIWHELGEPSSLSKEQLKLLRECAKPLVETQRIEDESLVLSVDPNGVVFFEIKNAPIVSDRGYDYEKVLSTR